MITDLALEGLDEPDLIPADLVEWQPGSIWPFSSQAAIGAGLLLFTAGLVAAAYFAGRASRD